MRENNSGLDAQLGDATDAALVRAARLGDVDAFAVIVDRYGQLMYRYAFRLVGNEHDAAEVVQEALVSAWSGLHSFAGLSSLKTWLYRLVHRRTADLIRRRRPTPVGGDDVLTQLAGPAAREETADPARQYADSELLEELHSVLQTLPWTQRSVWVLRELEEMSYDEIASTLGIPVGSVRGHLHRGRRTVSERMSSWR